MKRVVWLLLLLLPACGYTEMHEVVLRKPTAPGTGPLEVYRAGQPVARPFYEVAILQAIGRGSEATGDDALRGLVIRGQALGCDALVQVHVDEGVSIAHAAGVCVKYTRIEGAPAAPVPTEPKPQSPESEPKSPSEPDAPSEPREPKEGDGAAGTPI